MNVHLITKRHSNVTPPLQLLPPRLLLLRLNAVCNIPLSSVIQPISNDSDSQLDTETVKNEDNFDNSIFDDSETFKHNDTRFDSNDENDEGNDDTLLESNDENDSRFDSNDENDEGNDDTRFDSNDENNEDEYFKSNMFTGGEKEKNTFFDNQTSVKPFINKKHKHSSNKKKKSQKRSKSAHFFGDL